MIIQQLFIFINKGSTAHPLSMHALRLLFWLSAIYNFRFTAVYVQGHFNTIVSAVSYLHEPTAVAKCVTFCHHLQQVQPCQPPDSTPLTQHMTLHSCNFLFSRLQGQLAQQLQEEIYQDRFHTSAEGTKASYCTHRTSYLRFCEHIGYPPLPAQSSFLSVCCLFSSQSQSHFYSKLP